MRKKLLVLFISCFLIISTLIGGCAVTQSKPTSTTIQYPTKPITIIVPFSVGGSGDILARMLEKSAVKHLGQPLVVINKPGGAGVLAWNELVNARPDGYTIGLASGEMLLQPILGPTKYHFPTALEPLAQIASNPMILAIKADQPWKNIQDLIEYAKQHPGELKFSHVGIGSINHITGEALAKTAGITLEQVPFQGGSEAVTALLGGHVQIVIISPSQLKEHIKNGTIRALAVATDQRLHDPMLANIPTFKEQGLDIEFINWWGIAAPKELPPDIKNKLAEGLQQTITDPEFQQDIGNIGFEGKYLNPQEFEAFWISEDRKFSKIIQEAGILERIQSQKE